MASYDEGIPALLEQYNKLQAPYLQDAERAVRTSMAGTPGLYGSPRMAGIGKVQQQGLQNMGEYQKGLMENALITPYQQSYIDIQNRPYNQMTKAQEWETQNMTPYQRASVDSANRLAEQQNMQPYMDLLLSMMQGGGYGGSGFGGYGGGGGGGTPSGSNPYNFPGSTNNPITNSFANWSTDPNTWTSPQDMWGNAGQTWNNLVNAPANIAGGIGDYGNALYNWATGGGGTAGAVAGLPSAGAGAGILGGIGTIPALGIGAVAGKGLVDFATNALGWNQPRSPQKKWKDDMAMAELYSKAGKGDMGSYDQLMSMLKNLDAYKQGKVGEDYFRNLIATSAPNFKQWMIDNPEMPS